MSEVETTEPDATASLEPGAGALPVNRGNAGKGRPKGSRNKVTLAAREAILLAAEEMGGVQGLVAWARKNDENEKIFWSVIYPKVLPYGGGPAVSAAAAVTGALVWRRPDSVQTGEPATAITVADAAAAADAVPAADAPPPNSAVPASTGARIVWRAPGPPGKSGLPGLPGGSSLETSGARPPPENST